ncbi:MAG: hypothetical protein AAFZ01_04675 [Pseudomonadota bacterium]
MSSISMRTRARTRGLRVAKRRAHSIARFDPRVRDIVAACAAQDERLADLAVSFPALLFTLAWPRRGVDHSPAYAAVREGARLREIARLAGVPLWLRRVPIEAFTTPLPELTDTPAFRCRIADAIPLSPRVAPVWFETVCEALTWGTPEAAIWLGFYRKYRSDALPTKQIRLLMLWAWYTGKTTVPAQVRSDYIWRKEMSLKAAKESANDWFSQIRLHMTLDATPINDPWLTPQTVGDFVFIPLSTSQDLIDEAEALSNCLAINGYGYSILRHQSRIWSIRKDGKHVAACEVTRSKKFFAPQIRQLEGPNNGTVDRDVAEAVYRWISAHDFVAHDFDEPRHDRMKLNKRLWVRAWRPYWLAKKRIPEWLPLVPSRRLLYGVDE